MTSARVARRLAAILAIDRVGFSRLMEADEEGTIARQRANRRADIDRILRDHGGRIVKTTGDGLLVEFGRVVDAVDSAVRIQRAIAEAGAAVPKDRLIRHRAARGIKQSAGAPRAPRLQRRSRPDAGRCFSPRKRHPTSGRSRTAKVGTLYQPWRYPGIGP